MQTMRYKGRIVNHIRFAICTSTLMNKIDVFFIWIKQQLSSSLNEMSLIGTVFGIDVDDSFDLAKFFKLVAKKVTVILPNCLEEPYNQLSKGPSDMCRFRIILEDDIGTDEEITIDGKDRVIESRLYDLDHGFYNLTNPEIKIEYVVPCGLMIYPEVDEDDNINEQAVIDLISWRKRLVLEGRLRSECTLKLKIGNF